MDGAGLPTAGGGCNWSLRAGGADDPGVAGAGLNVVGGITGIAAGHAGGAVTTRFGWARYAAGGGGAAGIV